jgi:fructose/tagatose bisphosphate aldolase
MALAKLSELLSSVKDNSYAIGSFQIWKWQWEQ